MDEKIIRAKIRNFILNDLIRDETYDLKDDEGIVTSGLIDSFALAEFGVFVEDEFDIYIPDADLTVEKMDTVILMTARVLQGANS